VFNIYKGSFRIFLYKRLRATIIGSVTIFTSKLPFEEVVFILNVAGLAPTISTVSQPS